MSGQGLTYGGTELPRDSGTGWDTSRLDVICVNRQDGFELAASTASGRRVHLIGAAGAGMRSLAEVLGQDGWRLTGSDAGGRA
ncbi:MAG TPA: Mur ligase domain-containing protein, partial [Pirellulales bacterium]|nr:Mur ligase domain-containing protein [Pirellulales bacterium]